MESNWITRNRKTILKVLLLAALGLALYSVRRDLLNTLSPFFYATIFAYLLNPLINFLQKKGIARSFGAFLAVLLMFLLLMAFFTMFIPSLVRDAYTLLSRLSFGVQSLRTLLDDILSTLRETLGGAVDLDQEFNTLINNLIALLSDAVTRLLASVGGIIDVLLIPVITFYLLKDKDHILQTLQELFPSAMRPRLRQMGNNARGVLGGYVRGKLIISAAVGLLTGLGCLALGLPNTLTIGIVAGLFDLIPYFGPWLGGILPVIIALISKPPLTAVWVLLLILVIQQVESNLITPRVISERVGLHPLIVMFSVMFFGAIMGIPGMILGVPFVAVTSALINLLRKQEAAPATPQAPVAQTPTPPPPQPEGDTTP